MAIRGREALLTHATNAHTDGDSWIYLADANVIFTGDLFYNNGAYPMIDYANGGDIRGMVRANCGEAASNVLYFGLVRLCRLGHDVPWVKA